MSGAVGPLHVGMEARDPTRRHALLGLLAEGGNEPASSAEDADVLVCDLGPGEPPPRARGATLVVLTDQPDLDRDPRFAAVLPRQVTARRSRRRSSRSRPGSSFAPGRRCPSPASMRRRRGAELGLLTPREVEILAAIGEGLSNKEVARRLGISAHTVKFHLEAIFDKLGAGSRAEAVAKGLRRGVIEL